MAGTEVGVIYDPFDPAFHADPYPSWSWLREHEPLHRRPDGIYVVTRYEDVWRLLRDHRVGREFPPELVRFAFGDGSAGQSFSRNMINREGPDHTRMRKLMALPFTPKRVRDLRERTVGIVDDLLDGADDRLDVAADLGAVVPVFVICDLLGLPRDDRELVRPWAAAMAEASMMLPPDHVRDANEAALQSFRDYFAGLLAGRRRYEADGLFAALVAAESDGERLDTEELVVNATLLFFAGFETTSNLIGNGVLALLEHPDQLQRLRRNPALIASAVDEMLRYDSPVQTAPRFTNTAVETAGGTIKANRAIELSLAAANRDPRVFTEPDRFDIARADNSHVAFGSGAHFCLGSHLARLEAQVTIGALVDRYAFIERDGAAVRKASSGIRGLDSLPVRVTPR